MTRRCTECPSYLPPGDVQDSFGRPVQAPMCGRHGFVLGAPKQDPIAAENALMAFAEDCADFGEPRPGTPVSLRPRVATVSESVIEGGPTGQRVSTCHGCTNCVKADAVYTEWGYTLPVCKAKGTLIFNPTSDNVGCEWASPGPPTDSLYEIELRKEFKDNFSIVGTDEALATFLGNGKLAVEPTTYETDAPVDPEDRADGIRAWRKLECPFGTGREIFLPIFDSSEAGIFSASERKKIPQTGDAHMPELYVDYASLVWRFAVEEWQLGQTLLIQSFPGLGKTEFAYYLGWLMQLPVTRLYFTDSIEWDDIFGKPGFSPEEGTYWMDGRFTAAYKRPGIELVDEPNMAKSEIVATLRTTTENDSTIFLDAGYARDEEEQEMLEIKPHRYNFRIWVANPAWDPRNIGTKELAAADISRISPAFLTYPPEEVERRIIRTTLADMDGYEIPDELLDDMMKVSTDIRQASDNGDFPGTWGIRENVKVARKLAWYPFVEAYRMAVLNYYEPETAAFIIDSSIKTIRADDIKRR